jgi:hypothetical protein
MTINHFSISPRPPRPLRLVSVFFLPCSPCLRGALPVVFFFVLLFALLMRSGILLATPGALVDDPDGYRRLAENLVEHGTLGAGQTPTAFRPPLYPLLLTGCAALGAHARVAIGVLHVSLGVATVGLVFVLARWWGLGKSAAALAALLVACDPILLVQSTQVMTETPAVFFAAAGLVALTWRGRRSNRREWAALLTGAILALGALCRPAFMLWMIAAGVVMGAASERPTTGRRVLRNVPAYFLGAALVLSPWAIRNQLQFGCPIVTTTHGGYTLLLANNPEFYEWLRVGPWGSVWRADRFNADWQQRRPHDELSADRLAYAEAWQTIADDPGTFVYASLVRVGRFWSPLPHRIADDETRVRRLSRYVVGLWYIAEFLLATIGAWQLTRISPLPHAGKGSGVRASSQSGGPNESSVPPSAFPLPPSFSWRFGLLLIACLTAVHTVYWTDMRMRAPLMPVVALLAAVGVATLLTRKKSHAGESIEA